MWAPTAVVQVLTLVLAVTVLALTVASAGIRGQRQVRQTRRRLALEQARPLLLAALDERVDAEQNPAGAGQTTAKPDASLPRVVSRSLEELAVSLIPKLRGQDRAALVEMLTRRGTIAAARRKTRSLRPIVRLRSVELLGALGHGDSLPELRARLDDRNPDVRRAAVRAVGHTGRPAAATALLSLLGRERRGVPEHCVTLALLRLGQVSLPELIAAVGDGTPAARRAAAQALGWLGDPAAVTTLVAALDDDEATVGVAAVEALGRIGVPVGATALRARLGAERPRAERLAAAQALGRLGDPLAAPDLAGLLREDHDLARTAGAALALLGGAGQQVLAAEAGEVAEAREFLVGLVGATSPGSGLAASDGAP